MRLASCLFLGIVALVASPVGEAPAAAVEVMATAPVGGLDLLYDPTIWNVTSDERGTQVVCQAHDCRDVYLTITVADPEESPCTEALLTGYWGTDAATTVKANALSFLVTTLDFGCRNLAGGPLYACTAHRDKTYFVAAPGDHCHTPWHHEDIVLGVLQGLRPR